MTAPRANTQSSTPPVDPETPGTPPADQPPAHPACKLFPLLSDDEFNALKRDIKEHGQRQPILLLRGEVVDGRNRLRACCELGIEPRIEDLTDGQDPISVVMSLNFHRRHLRPHEKGAALRAYLEHLGWKPEEKHKGGRPSKVKEPSEPRTVSIAEVAASLAIPKQTAHDQLAAAEDYRTATPELRARVDAGDLTPKQVRKLIVREKKIQKAPISVTRVPAEVEADLLTYAARSDKFATIYADPPWEHPNEGTRASREGDYPAQTVEAICSLPVRDLVADHAHLHLWTTSDFLFEAQRVMQAWGFTYRSCFVWVKQELGPGNYWRVSHEYLLLGVRGAAAFLARNERSWQEFRRGRHGAKPAEVREIIESVSPAPRLELYARERVAGWSAWGSLVTGTPRTGENG